MLDFLRGFMHNPLNMAILRNTLSELLPVVGILRLTEEEILQQVAWQIAEGYIRLVKLAESPLHSTGPGTSSEDDSEADSSAGQDAGSGADSGAGSQTAAGATETAAESSTDADDTASQEEETDWIEFRIVDDETGQPVSGIVLKVKLPNGETKDYTTDSSGTVRIEDLPSGTCDIVEMTDPDASEVVLVE